MYTLKQNYFLGFFILVIEVSLKSSGNCIFHMEMQLTVDILRKWHMQLLFMA